MVLANLVDDYSLFKWLKIPTSLLLSLEGELPRLYGFQIFSIMLQLKMLLLTGDILERFYKGHQNFLRYDGVDANVLKLDVLKQCAETVLGALVSEIY